MVTKEHKSRKTCCFYASEYHLEMIILPYIKERLHASKFVIMTDKDLDPTIKTLLEKINIEDESKNQIKKIDWKADDFKKFKEIKKYVENQENVQVFVSGDTNYINNINRNMEKWNNKNINVIDCFNINNIKDDIKEISKNYEVILNTTKI